MQEFSKEDWDTLKEQGFLINVLTDNIDIHGVSPVKKCINDYLNTQIEEIEETPIDLDIIRRYISIFTKKKEWGMPDVSLLLGTSSDDPDMDKIMQMMQTDREKRTIKLMKEVDTFLDIMFPNMNTDTLQKLKRQVILLFAKVINNSNKNIQGNLRKEVLVLITYYFLMNQGMVQDADLKHMMSLQSINSISKGQKLLDTSLTEKGDVKFITFGKITTLIDCQFNIEPQDVYKIVDMYTYFSPMLPDYNSSQIMNGIVFIVLKSKGVTEEIMIEKCNKIKNIAELRKTVANIEEYM